MSHVVDLEPWHDLFLATAGAGSALAGLIIVAISANVTTILTIPSMTSRAATTIAVLVLIVVISCAALVPDQPVRALGVEVALAAALTTAVAVRSARHILREATAETSRALPVAKAALGLAPAAGALAGGLLLTLGAPAGLHLTAAAIIVGFAATVTNAWVLLVEILR